VFFPVILFRVTRLVLGMMFVCVIIECPAKIQVCTYRNEQNNDNNANRLSHLNASTESGRLLCVFTYHFPKYTYLTAMIQFVLHNMKPEATKGLLTLFYLIHIIDDSHGTHVHINF